MKQFDFDPYKSEINIRLATEYQPKILKNKITSRPYNGILYIIEGSYHYTFTGGSDATANAGDLLFLPMNCAPYSYVISSKDTPARTAQIEFEVRSGSSPIRIADRPAVCSCINRSDAEETIKSVISAFTSSKADSKFMAISGLYRLLAIFEANADNQNGRSAAMAIQPAVAYLEQHYAERIDSQELAALCHMSPSQLRRIFHEVHGIPPMQYKRNLIFKVAKRLLKTGDFKIGEIADMLGFNDIYEFSHFFIKMAGISPREYQNQD